MCQNVSETTGWWFQPIWKILVKLDNFPKTGMNMKNIWNHHPESTSYLDCSQSSRSTLSSPPNLFHFCSKKSAKKKNMRLRFSVVDSKKKGPGNLECQGNPLFSWKFLLRRFWRNFPYCCKGWDRIETWCLHEKSARPWFLFVQLSILSHQFVCNVLCQRYQGWR